MADRSGPLSSAEHGERRVVVTGMGAVTPIGNDVPSYWASLVAGRSGIERIASFDPARVERRSTRLGWTARSPARSRASCPRT